MKYIKKQLDLLGIVLISMIFTLPISAQVSIGSGKAPQTFSVLELSTAIKNGGLRMPQLTTDERNALSDFWSKSDEANEFKGLAIYNTDNQCLEFWNSLKWISFCDDFLIAPIGVTITPIMATTYALSTVTLTSHLNPADASNVQYVWERSLDGENWEVVAGETASTLDAQALIVGVTQYKLIVSNKAGSAISNIAFITGTMPPAPERFANIQMYVGAFWRWSQKGERLIQFNVGDASYTNYGKWTASVAWYDANWDPDNTGNPDGINLAINATPLSLPLADMNAENRPVTGGSRVISGSVDPNGIISFRIGLDKLFADSASVPARYAVVLLSYNNGAKLQKLFIRQGEGDDYLMRSEDAGTGIPAGRPAAVKFSPYNLTDPQKRSPVDWDTATALGTNNGVFTDFPTKAGYFFIYSATKAFAPDVPLLSINAWGQDIGGHSHTGNPSTGLYWDPSWESCPPGYRRPTDNSAPTTAYGSGAVAGSEMRQSLWADAITGTANNTYNSVWGYYADGYFDRRARVTSLGTLTADNSAVATNSPEVAYVGRLFFNPTTSASLFFPGAGYRYWQRATLFSAGTRARYWTSTSQMNNNTGYNAWFMYLHTDNVNNSAEVWYNDEIDGTYVVALSNSTKTSGASVRCVKATP